jgi:hypothetical protein
MKLLKIEGDNFVFRLSKREKLLLCELLKLYPLIPGSYHRTRQQSIVGKVASDERLLEEALAGQRQENKKQLRRMINEPNRFQEEHAGFRLSLTGQQMEWLLQVLNDVRVGSWLQLGCPDEKKGKPAKLTDRNARYLFALETCGLFQFALLEALEHGPAT